MAEKVFTQCTVGGPVKVYVEDGVIKRMRPIIFDENDKGGWTIEAKGKKFSDPRRTTLNPYVVGERMRIYSENRIKYPYRRKNFDPNGERHPELRGMKPWILLPAKLRVLERHTVLQPLRQWLLLTIIGDCFITRWVLIPVSITC